MEETKKFHERIALEGVNPILPNELRLDALNILAHTAFPTTRTEAWKYTRTTKISNSTFAFNTSQAIQSVEEYKIEGLQGSVIVFVNGFFNAALSDIQAEEGVTIRPLSTVGAEWLKENVNQKLQVEGEVFNALNNYYTTDGIAIEIGKKINAANSIQIIAISTGLNTLTSTRNVIISHENSAAHITFNYVGNQSDTNFTNTITEIYVKDNASLTIDKIQNEGVNDYHISSEIITQHKDSRFTLFTGTFSGAIVRNNVFVHVEGENAETNLYGTYLLNGKQVVDNHTTVDHKVPNCYSNELYKGVLNDQSTGVFNGKVFVRQDAQKINAFQSNANVLLSDNATMNSKPELEIYADDVKCSHGSTTGQIDEEAIYYLRARGISEKSAKNLMINGFIGDVTEKIKSEAVSTKISDLVSEKLGYTF